MKFKAGYLFFILFPIIAFSACNTSKKINSMAGKEGTKIKFMTYNIRHGAPIHKPDDDIQLEQLAKVIKSENPDIVALQEVDSVTKRAPLDEARELGELTGMHYAYFKAIDYQGGKYGVGILSRYPILKKQQQQLALPDPSGEPRTVGVITIEPVKGVKINFATTHLDLKK